MTKNRYTEIIQNVNLSLEAILRIEKYTLYQILYSQKCFGNMIVDLKYENLGFRFISDRGEASAYVYLLDEKMCFWLNDILWYIKIPKVRYNTNFFDYLRDYANMLSLNGEKIVAIFETKNSVEALKKILVPRDIDILCSDSSQTRVIFKAE